MDKKRIDEMWGRPGSLYEIINEMNKEIERLKKFAKNVNTFGTKIYPELVDISEDKSH
ncbi:MAG: hypothetical protein ACTSUF_03500 [Candidatus Heimdallarchaeaceae archaeon]